MGVDDRNKSASLLVGETPCRSNLSLDDFAVTLREYLNRRTRRILVLVGVLAVTIWVSTATVPVLAQFRFDGFYIPLLLVLGAAIVANRARCPRCSARLSYLDYGSRRRRVAPRVGLDRCSGCGLHLNEQLDDNDAV